MIAFIVGSAIGLILGLTGAGGSILAIPLLVFVLKIPMQDAIGLSLMTVMAGAFFGVLHRIRAGDIAWMPALIFAVGGMIVSPLGYHLAQRLPETWLLGSFVVLMWVVAGRMYLKTIRHPEESAVVRASKVSHISEDEALNQAVCRLTPSGSLHPTWSCRLTLIALGAVTGLLSGLFGVGGGFLIVPTLLFFTQLSLIQAIGTSLVVIVLISASGTVAFLQSQYAALDHILIAYLVAGAMAGMTAGTLLSKRLAGPRLQQIFAAVIAAMSLLIGFKLFH